MASSEEMNDVSDGILTYIPQRPPMVMVGRLESVEGKTTKTSFWVSEDNIFCRGGYLTEAGVIENIAQTAAAGAGYQAKLNGKEPPPGFIGQIRNLTIYFLPSTGQVINTEVTVAHEVMDATVIKGISSSGDRLLAVCEMTIFSIKKIE